jgi:hypothetical protein
VREKEIAVRNGGVESLIIALIYVQADVFRVQSERMLRKPRAIVRQNVVVFASVGIDISELKKSSSKTGVQKSSNPYAKTDYGF